MEGVRDRDWELVHLRREASWVMLVLMTSLSWQGLRRSLEAEYTFILLIKFNALFYKSSKTKLSFVGLPITEFGVVPLNDYRFRL